MAIVFQATLHGSIICHNHSLVRGFSQLHIDVWLSASGAPRVDFFVVLPTFRYKLQLPSTGGMTLAGESAAVTKLSSSHTRHCQR
jgi:hypothetical protein